MKLATKKRADKKVQVARLAETARDALRRLTNSSRCVDLLEGGRQGLKSQLSKTVTGLDSVADESGNREREVKAFKPRVRMFGNEMDSLERLETSSCDLEMMTLKVADAQGDITNRVIRLR